MIDDLDGGSVLSSTTTLTLANIGPQNVQVVLDQPMTQEGTAIVLAGTFADPGVGETHTFLWEATTITGQVIASASGNLLPGQVVPNFSFIPDNDGPYFARLTIDDGDDAASGLLAINAENVAPQNVTLQVSSNQLQPGQPLFISGSFQDPGSDLWQATLEVRPAGSGQAIFRVPLILEDLTTGGPIFASSLLIGQSGQFEVLVLIDDGSEVVSSNGAQITIMGSSDAQWTGGGTVGNVGDGTTWGDANNWTINGVNDVAPASGPPGDNVTFQTTPTVGSIDLGSDRTVNSVTIPTLLPITR